MLRLLHTADWHLGHTLHELPRLHEHERFLAWLAGVIESEEVDALVIAGDVFDSANPPTAALELWYRFLASLPARRPGLDVVVIGGNHDSAARLDAPEPVLAGLGVHVVGGLPRWGGALDLDRLVVPLRDRQGEVAAQVAAVPYLRPADLPSAPDAADPLVAGVRALYDEVLAEARRRREPGQALVALGHCYMVGTELSLVSERRILGGNQHALPASLFPDDVSYVALGHLHKAQRVGREHVRYSGSPIPMSLAEARYRHQVLLADLEGDAPAVVRSLPVPRAVDIVRVPARGAAPLDEVLAGLAGLEPAGDPRDPERPYLEVCVALEAPAPELRRQVEEAAAGRRPRLCKITVEYTGDGIALADAGPAERLADLDPEEVFLRRWRRDHDAEPPPELLAAFHELLDEVRQGEAP